MIQKDLLNRAYLQQLRDAASNLAMNVSNQNWVRAYWELADAADRLDAMQARSCADTSIDEVTVPDATPVVIVEGRPQA